MPFHLYSGRDQKFAPGDVATDYVAIGIRTGPDGTREDVRQIVEQPQPQFAIEGAAPKNDIPQVDLPLLEAVRTELVLELSDPRLWPGREGLQGLRMPEVLPVK